MPHAGGQTLDPDKVLCVILGGGKGTGLFPLTKDRAEPAVPLAGKYRIGDIPISNCINSHLRNIYVLTQFNSLSLHSHISGAYSFDHFSPGFLQILPAQQTFTDTSWYEGTADAVRKNLARFLSQEYSCLLILSADQLYRMDFQALLQQHGETGADITIATLPIGRDEANAFGILQIDNDKRITRFVEKPKDEAVLDTLRLAPDMQNRLGLAGGDKSFLASMGIYVFNCNVISRLLDNPVRDFGEHIIPRVLNTHRVFAYVHRGYWKDIGTIRSFFNANLDLVTDSPRFNFFDMNAPIFTRPHYLPGSRIHGARIDHAVIADGCLIHRARINHCIIGQGSIVGEGTELNQVVYFGNDYYEQWQPVVEHEREGQPPLGIGAHCKIENAIIDKDACIGNHVIISPAGKPEHMDHERYYIRDGIVIIPKNAIIPDGMVI
jgi:glucose-1-phosphate adenylyltransferase